MASPRHSEVASRRPRWPDFCRGANKNAIRLEMQGHVAHRALGTVETKIPLFYAKIKREIVQPPVFNPMTAFSRAPNVRIFCCIIKAK